MASFPRSGNTWLRFMIEKATGEPAGSVYEDRIMPRGPNGVVIKTHELDSYRYTHAIHLVRNPFDAIESYFHWKRDVADLEMAWDDHFQASVADWRAHAVHWLEAEGRKYRVRYEDLHSDTVGELGEVVQWLGFEVPPSRLRTVAEASSLDKMRREVSDLGGRFFRRGQVNAGIDQFTEDQIRITIESLGDLLKVCGYDQLP